MRSLILFLTSFFFISCGTESEETIENEIVHWDANTIVFTPVDIQGNLLIKQKIKPLNGMGNGPLYTYQNGHFINDWTNSFKDLNIPIIRFHDIEYFNAQNKAINISAIFPDEQADALTEASYDFTATDQLMKAAMSTGAKIIFRLGENIQNIGSATGSNKPPKDFHKWAKIAERIVAHYEDGWNDGYFYKNIMWEVWNEPDVEKCWDGTFDDYCEFYKIVWQCIHTLHPKADISPSYAYDKENRTKLYQFIIQNNLDIKHCFYHRYWDNFSTVEEYTTDLKNELKQFGLEADIIMNEWNFLSSEDNFNNNDLGKTFIAIQTPLIATWYAQQLIHMQAAENLAGAVYYTSDMPGLWTGLYRLNNTGDIVLLPTYDIFKYFGELYKLGNEIAADNLPEDISALAASDGKEMGIMVVNYSDKKKNTKIAMNNISLQNRDILINEIPYQLDSEYIDIEMSPYEVSFISISELKQ